MSVPVALYGDASGQFSVPAVMRSEDVAVGSVVPVIGPGVAVLALSILPALAPILASLCAGSCNFSGVGTGRWFLVTPPVLRRPPLGFADPFGLVVADLAGSSSSELGYSS